MGGVGCPLFAGTCVSFYCLFLMSWGSGATEPCSAFFLVKCWKSYQVSTERRRPTGNYKEERGCLLSKQAVHVECVCSLKGISHMDVCQVSSHLATSLAFLFMTRDFSVSATSDAQPGLRFLARTRGLNPRQSLPPASPPTTSSTLLSYTCYAHTSLSLSSLIPFLSESKLQVKKDGGLKRDDNQFRVLVKKYG